jgi:hypothetical protein
LKTEKVPFWYEAQKHGMKANEPVYPPTHPAVTPLQLSNSAIRLAGIARPSSATHWPDYAGNVRGRLPVGSQVLVSNRIYFLPRSLWKPGYSGQASLDVLQGARQDAVHPNFHRQAAGILQEFGIFAKRNVMFC